MNDTCQPALRDTDSLRTMAIVAYACLLGGLVTFHLAAVGGVIIAYIQRDEALGTVWESHYEAIITTFWATLVGLIAGLILCLVLIGFVILPIVAIWFLYRTLRGLVHAVDGKPY